MGWIRTCRPALEDLVVRTLVSDEVFAFPPFPPVLLDGIVIDWVVRYLVWWDERGKRTEMDGGDGRRVAVGC